MKKLFGEERRQTIIDLLKKQNHPLTGSDLAKTTNVSRQVIVNDINLLKAKNEPIISTSQGYIYMSDPTAHLIEKKIVCSHTKEQTRDELYTIIDCGAIVKNVIVEHPIYGEVTASLHLTNRIEIDQFLQKIEETNAGLLSALTDGTHLHIIAAPTEQQLQLAEQKLRDLGFLIEN